MAPITIHTQPSVAETYDIMAFEPNVGRGNIDTLNLPPSYIESLDPSPEFFNPTVQTGAQATDDQGFRRNITSTIAAIRKIHGDDMARHATEVTLHAERQKKQQNEGRADPSVKHPHLSKLMDILKLKVLFKKGEGLLRSSRAQY